MSPTVNSSKQRPALARKRRGPTSFAIATIAVLRNAVPLLASTPQGGCPALRGRICRTEPARERSVSEAPAGGDNVRSDVPKGKTGALGDGAGSLRRREPAAVPRSRIDRRPRSGWAARRQFALGGGLSRPAIAPVRPGQRPVRRRHRFFWPVAAPGAPRHVQLRLSRHDACDRGGAADSEIGGARAAARPPVAGQPLARFRAVVGGIGRSWQRRLAFSGAPPILAAAAELT